MKKLLGIISAFVAFSTLPAHPASLVVTFDQQFGDSFLTITFANSIVNDTTFDGTDFIKRQWTGDIFPSHPLDLTGTTTTIFGSVSYSTVSGQATLDNGFGYFERFPSTNFTPYPFSREFGNTMTGLALYSPGNGGFTRFFLTQAVYNATGTAANFVSAPVPEPETCAMLIAGLGLLGFAARRRKKLAS